TLTALRHSRERRIGLDDRKLHVECERTRIDLRPRVLSEEQSVADDVLHRDANGEMLVDGTDAEVYALTEARGRGGVERRLRPRALEAHRPRRAGLAGIAVEQNLDRVRAQLAALVGRGTELERERPEAHRERAGALGLE